MNGMFLALWKLLETVHTFDFMGSKASNADKSAFRLLPAAWGEDVAKLLAPPRMFCQRQLVNLF